MKCVRASLFLLGVIFTTTQPTVAKEAWREKVKAFAEVNFTVGVAVGISWRCFDNSLELAAI
jgi:hypothetical protein